MRRRRRSEFTVSLFPFLSVLACVIGTLTLLLAAVAVGAMGKRSLEKVHLLERMRSVEMFLAGGRAHLIELEAQLVEQEERTQEEEELGRRLYGLGLSRDISLQELDALLELKKEVLELESSSRQLEEEEKSLQSAESARQSELQTRAAERLRTPIVIDPTGLGKDWRPFLVECTKDYLELYRTRGDWSIRIPADQLARNADYRKYLKRVRAIHDSLLIFLIRPGGVAVFMEAEAIAYRHQVRNAKLPLPGDGELDFKHMAGQRP